MAAITAFMVLLGLPAADAQNLLDNPNFDDSLQLTGWAALASSWDTQDWQDQIDSGSITNTNSLPSPSSISLGRQCVAVSDPGLEYLLSGYIRIPTGQTASGRAKLTVVWYEAPSCEESSTISGADTPSVFENDTWLETSLSLSLPPEAQSVKILLGLYKSTADGEIQAWIDHVYFGQAPFFSAGFETADLSEWSSSVGG